MIFVKQSLITNVATTDPLASVAPTDPLAERKTKDKFQLTSGYLQAKHSIITETSNLVVQHCSQEISLDL